jgi:geranyl diphosphate 2-C-methyltransferase
MTNTVSPSTGPSGKVSVDKVIRSDYDRDLARYWDSKRDDEVNLALGRVDGLYHHHYGVGSIDPIVLRLPAAVREPAIVSELHRLENQQTELILDALTPLHLTAQDRVLDAGSGRGGTSFMIADRFGCHIDGVNISRYQIEFATNLALERGYADRVQFHYRNMLTTGFETASFQAAVSNETTMYVDLFELFAEFARLLVPGGRYVVFTWCYNDIAGRPRQDIDAINAHYQCHIHPRSTYFAALAANGLVPRTVMDYTRQAEPYWMLRADCALATGIEQPFLSAYGADAMNFLLIVADRTGETR